LRARDDDTDNRWYGGFAMTQPAKPEVQEPLPPDPYPDYPPAYSFLFQSWLILCLGVICIALGLYLYSYIRGLF
jgi:hypothetical protein